MARLTSPKSTLRSAWDEYGGWIIIIFFLYVLWSFRQVFSSLGDTAGEAVGAAVASTAAAAKVKAEKAKVQQATGTKTNYSDAQLATFRADATTLAGHFKTLETLPFLEKQLSFANGDGAFSLLKQRYSRCRLINNKPFEYTGPVTKAGTRPVKSLSSETAACVKNAINYKVLIPYYKEVTGGRDMVTDIRATLAATKYQPTINWVL